MINEDRPFSGDPVLTKALFSLNPEDRRSLSLNGHRITLGIPDLKTIEGRTLIIIPDTPHIFHTRTITFFTLKNHHENKFTLFNQLVILGHGKVGRDDPMGWLFYDGQDPLKITADFNASDIGLPNISAIICCREIIPTLREGARPITNTQFAKGWPSIPNVIIPKCGRVNFSGEVTELGIDTTVSSTESDFYRISKKGKPINLRKYHSRYF